MEMKPWCKLAFPERRKRAQRRLTSSPSGTKLHYKSYESLEEKEKERKIEENRLDSGYDQQRANSVTG